MKKILTIITVCLATASFSQQKIITGTVSSKTTNQPLQGVSVQGKNTSVTTDSSGRFSIQASAGENLRLSFVGMNPLNFTVTKATQNVDITMEEASGTLEQIVVTGYKTERKIDLTGAVSVVNLRDIKNIPATSPMLALQGHVPGLYIQTDGSPTGSNNRAIFIRGLNSLGDASPLYIIDGVPTKRYEVFANLNPNSISSIQVLKDASSSSIYGSRASNGVIIVTTKEGEITTGQEKVHIQFNSSISAQTERPWQIPVLTSEQRGISLWQAAVNDKTDPNVNPAIYTYDWNGDYSNPVLNKVNIQPFVGGDSLEPVGNTNWQNEVYKTAIVSSNELTVSAGSSKSGLLIDLGYYKNSGLMVYTFFERYSARINGHTSLFNGKLKIGQNLMLTRTAQIYSNTDVGGAQIPGLAITLAPTIPVYKKDGKFAGPEGAGYSDRNNPVHMLYLNRWNIQKQFLIFGNVYAEIEPIKHLVFRTSLGGDYSDFRGKNILPSFSAEGPGRATNSLSLQESKDLAFTWSNTLTYQTVLGKNQINVLLGTEAIKDDYSSFGAYRENFSVQDQNYFYLSAGTGASTNNGSATGYRLLSQFGKIFYGYSDKYLASLTVRRDGSSRFGINNQYGIFPAFSLGWRINNENFFKGITSVSNLKLRAGVGRVGNQEIGNEARFGLLQANYGTIGTGGFGQGWPAAWLNTGTAYDITGANSGTLPSGFVQIQAENPNLKWESTDELNIGTDFGFLNERLTGSFDYFIRKTSNILIQPPIASAVGEGQLEWFNGATKSNKGWEVILGYHQNRARFSYSIDGSVSHFHDEITQLPPEVRTAYAGNAEQSILGHSQASWFGYVTEGIFQNQDEVNKAATQIGAGVGRIRYKDLNGDGVINALDQTWLGTALPGIEYGLNLEFGYKNFNLTIFGSGVASKKFYDNVKQFNSFASVIQNAGPGVLHAWTPQNPNSDIPMLSLLNANSEDRLSNYYVVDGSYFKIRNVQLGYNFPNSLIKNLGMQALQLYLIGQNLVAFKSKQFLGKDPEQIGAMYNAWPVPTTITFGINVTF